MNEESNNIMFKNISEQIKELKDSIDSFMKDTSCKIQAEHDANIEHRTEIRVIKENMQKSADERVKILEENSQAHTELGKDIGNLKKQQYTWTGAIAVIVVVAQIIISYLTKKL